MAQINLMEVCGTHTMSIAKNGIRTLLPEKVRLLSGPGCPVCVTPAHVIDAVLKLSSADAVTICTYGDMLKVPGSLKGDSLLTRKACGASVEMVYSPMDALKLAMEEPEKEFVFLGVGFETTAPGTAACIQAAKAAGVKNFSVFCLLKRIEPALRCLIESPDFRVHGFLCPGHVAVILGEEGFRFLEEDYHIPSVIAGFEAEEILLASAMLLRQIADGKGKLENAYPKAVRPEGNPEAKQILREVFCGCDMDALSYADHWRGLGVIPGSGFLIGEPYAEYDAVRKYAVRFEEAKESPACRCGDVICGRLKPLDCPLFGTVCTPSDPEGPCMVSGEGACAAAYLYP